MNAVEWEGESGTDLREVFHSLYVRRWWIAASTVLFGALFAAYAFLATPWYASATVLAPAVHERGLGGLSGALGQVGGLASLAGLSLGGRDSTTEEALAVLRSRGFVEKFIADHDLLPRLFPRKWDAQAGAWKVAPEDQPTPAKGYEYFRKRVLGVGQDKKTGLVTVTVTWRDRDEAAAWANELVARLNAEMRGRAIAHATAYTQFLEKERAASPFIETREAINRLIEDQIRQRMLATVTREYAFRVIDRALPSDADDPEKPKKLLLLAAGPLLGLALALVFVLLYEAVRPLPRRPPPPGPG